MDNLKKAYEKEVLLDIIGMLADKRNDKQLKYILYDCGTKNLFDDVQFTLEAMKRTGEVALISALTSEEAIQKILHDKNLVNKIFTNKDIKRNSLLNGDEVLSVIITQLTRCDNLCDNKEFMMKVIDNVNQLNPDLSIDTDYALTRIIEEKCIGLFKDKSFYLKVMNLLERNSKDYMYNFGNFLLPTIAKKIEETHEKQEGIIHSGDEAKGTAQSGILDYGKINGTYQRYLVREEAKENDKTKEEL